MVRNKSISRSVNKIIRIMFKSLSDKHQLQFLSRIYNQVREREKDIKYNPNIDYDEKLISSTDQDYKSNEKRKNLI